MIRMLALFLVHVANLLATVELANAQAQQSPETRVFTVPDQIVGLNEEQLNFLRERFIISLRTWNDRADDQGGAGEARRILKRYVNPVLDAVTGGFLPDELQPLGVVPDLRDRIEAELFEGNAQAARTLRDFEVRENLFNTASNIVQLCRGDADCSRTFWDKLLVDERVRTEIERAGALGAINDAQTNVLAAEALRQGQEAYRDTIETIGDVDAVIQAGFEENHQALASGFAEIGESFKTLIEQATTIIHTQEAHTIALADLKARVDRNRQLIEAGVGNILALQRQNLALTGIILSAMVEIDAKLVDIQSTQLADIFTNSPIARQIQLLQDSRSPYYTLFCTRLRDTEGRETFDAQECNTTREAILDDLRPIKLRQDVVNAANLTAEYGTVAVAVLNEFCDNCPPEVTNGIQLGVEAAGIVGNVAAGNYPNAILATLGLFGEPQTSPELKMLSEITRQLGVLESNMNLQFQNLHSQLFDIEGRLTERLEVIDQKLDEIGRQVFLLRIETMEDLSGVSAQLSYIINQNDCAENLILTLTRLEGQELCRVPVDGFRAAMLAGRIQSFEDLDNFYRGATCANCVETLFDITRAVLGEAAFFRYSACQIEGADAKARPDRVYAFMFNYLRTDDGRDSTLATALTVPPSRVTDIPAVLDLVGEVPVEERLSFVLEDQYYRSPEMVLTFADYILTLFTFLELSDNGRLITPDEVNRNPGFARERSLALIIMLQHLIELLDRTQAQQSLMAGHGIIAAVDERLSAGENIVWGAPGEVRFSLSDLFRYNPYFRKNYSAYLLDRVLGFEGLRALVGSGQLAIAPVRLSFQGYSVVFESVAGGSILFSASLTNAAEPAESIALFTVEVPLLDGVVDEQMYRDALNFAVTPDAVDIEAMRRIVTEKLAMMYLVTDEELDRPSSQFSRSDLEVLVRDYRDLR